MVDLCEMKSWTKTSAKFLICLNLTHRNQSRLIFGAVTWAASSFSELAFDGDSSLWETARQLKNI